VRGDRDRDSIRVFENLGENALTSYGAAGSLSEISLGSGPRGRGPSRCEDYGRAFAHEHLRASADGYIGWT